MKNADKAITCILQRKDELKKEVQTAVDSYAYWKSKLDEIERIIRVFEECAKDE